MNRGILPIALALVALTACNRQAAQETTVQPNQTPPQQAEAPPPAPVAATDTTEACSIAQTVYYGYDSDSLTPDARNALEETARCLEEHPDEKVRLTGMADPRGTEEYNLALGARRAQSAAGYLERMGVADGRINTHSVGEELAAGEDEGTFERDRRTEIRPVQ